MTPVTIATYAVSQTVIPSRHPVGPALVLDPSTAVSVGGLVGWADKGYRSPVSLR